MDTVYVHIRHWTFWYGTYGICDKSCNDEVTIYSDNNKANLLGYFEVTTHVCLQYLLDNEIDKVEDAEFYNEIEDFLKSDNDICYSYIYPRFDEDIQDQVKHFAPVNEKGYKPVYIYVWSKLSDSWDIGEMKKCIKTLVKEFLHEDIDNVEFLETPTYEDTKSSYDKYYAPFVR